jgi:hypothetical protein
MELGRPPLVVAFELSEKRKAIVADALAGASAVVYLTELDEAARTKALRNTGVLLTFNTSKELRSGEARLAVPTATRPSVTPATGWKLMHRLVYWRFSCGDAVLDRVLHLLEGAHLDLAHALARQPKLVR